MQRILSLVAVALLTATSFAHAGGGGGPDDSDATLTATAKQGIATGIGHIIEGLEGVQESVDTIWQEISSEEWGSKDILFTINNTLKNIDENVVWTLLVCLFNAVLVLIIFAYVYATKKKVKNQNEEVARLVAIWSDPAQAAQAAAAAGSPTSPDPAPTPDPAAPVAGAPETAPEADPIPERVRRSVQLQGLGSHLNQAVDSYEEEVRAVKVKKVILEEDLRSANRKIRSALNDLFPEEPADLSKFKFGQEKEEGEETPSATS